MSFKLVLLFVFISIEEVFSQTTFDDFIEPYLQNEATTNIENNIDDLHFLYDNPININDKHLDNLLILPFISKSDILSINNYISNNGDLKSTKELVLVKGFTIKKIHKLKKFIILKPRKENLFIQRNSIMNGSFMSISRIQARYGGESRKKFDGNRYKHNYKLVYNYRNRVRAGVTMENDSGEKFQFNKNTWGFDYYSVYAQMNYTNKLEQINVGDYSLSWGQGLIASSNSFNSKSSNSVEFGLGNIPLHKYSSTDENSFLRGVALKYRITTNLSIIPVLSINNIDAHLAQDGIESFVNTGLHRNDLELQTKDAVSEKVYGFRVVMNSMKYQLGFNYLNYSFSDYILESKYSWKKKELIGYKNYNSSFDYRLSIGRMFLFGESAISSNKVMAHIVGVNIMTDDNIQLLTIARIYPADYQSRYSSGFGETHHTRNEKGLYFGVEYIPSHYLKINAYYDYFSFPSLGYRMSNSSDGDEYLVNIDYHYTSDIHLLFRYKFEKKAHDIKIDKITKTLDVNRSTYRLTFKYKINSVFRISPRLEYNTYKYLNSSESGHMFYCDLKYISLDSALKIQSRLAYYNSDSYNTRIYAYESDVLYAFSFPSYYYEGYRVYLNASYKFNKFLTFYTKVGFTYWMDRDNKQDVKFQLRIKI